MLDFKPSNSLPTLLVAIKPPESLMLSILYNSSKWLSMYYNKLFVKVTKANITYILFIPLHSFPFSLLFFLILFLSLNKFSLLSHSLCFLVFFKLTSLFHIILLSSSLFSLFLLNFCFFNSELLLDFHEVSFNLFFSVSTNLFDCSQSIFGFKNISFTISWLFCVHCWWMSLCSKWSKPPRLVTISPVSKVKALVLSSFVSHSSLHIYINRLMNVNIRI